MPDLDDAVAAITNPANVSALGATGPQRQFAVKQNRVLRALRDAGAGKAEARELALKALEKVGGGVDTSLDRGGVQRSRQRDRTIESWWIPAEAVRF
jgi:hypothetical protein